MRKSECSEMNDVSLSEKEYIRDLAKKLTLAEAPPLLDRNQADCIISKRLEKASTADSVKEIQARPKELYFSKNWDRIQVKEGVDKSLKECNPNYELGNEWKVNCQRCVPAYEMRRRGYDVTVLPKPREIKNTDLSYAPFSVWEKPQIINCSENGKADIESNMAQWGDGARAQIVVEWKGINSGHTFIAEQIAGETRYFDPQSGSKDVSDYFSHVEKGSVKVCRIDKLDVTEKIFDCCRKGS